MNRNWIQNQPIFFLSKDFFWIFRSPPEIERFATGYQYDLFVCLCVYMSDYYNFMAARSLHPFLRFSLFARVNATR